MINLLTASLLFGLALAALPARAQDIGGLLDGLIGDPSDQALDADPDFVADEILALDLSEATLQLARSLGFELLDTTPLTGLGYSIARLRLPDGFINVNALLATLAAADPTGVFTRNTRYRLAQGSACEGLRCVGQAQVRWPAGCARPVRLGMLDSAVDARHPALQGQRLSIKRIGQGAAGAAERDHGTAVAALLIGRADAGHAGLLPKASLYAADVFERDEHQRPVTDAYRLSQGLDWLARQPLDALNISLTGPDNPVLHRAVQALHKKGIAIAAAAGNSGPGSAPQYPAAYPEVLAVSAVDRQLRFYVKGSRGAHVGIAAPGVAVWTTSAAGAGRYRDGSSYATPFVTAALALLRGSGKAASPASAVKTLQAASRDLGDPGRDAVYGSGLLQLPAAACAP